MDKEREQKLILSMAGKIFASKGGSEKAAVGQANKILKEVGPHPDLELIAEVTATIFASPTKSGTAQNITTAIKQAKTLFDEVFHNQL